MYKLSSKSPFGIEIRIYISLQNLSQSSHHTFLHKFSSPVQAGPSLSQQFQPQPQPSSESHGNPVLLVVRSLKRAIIPTAVVLLKDLWHISSGKSSTRFVFRNKFHYRRNSKKSQASISAIFSRSFGNWGSSYEDKIIC